MKLRARHGRRFNSWNPPTLQLALIELLDASPMPWTGGMLRAWFPTLVGSRSIGIASETMRIWRIERGLYASSKYRTKPKPKPKRIHYPKVVVSDEMLARYGFNL